MEPEFEEIIKGYIEYGQPELALKKINSLFPNNKRAQFSKLNQLAIRITSLSCDLSIYFTNQDENQKQQTIKSIRNEVMTEFEQLLNLVPFIRNTDFPQYYELIGSVSTMGIRLNAYDTCKSHILQVITSMDIGENHNVPTVVAKLLANKDFSLAVARICCCLCLTYIQGRSFGEGVNVFSQVKYSEIPVDGPDIKRLKVLHTLCQLGHVQDRPANKFDNLSDLNYMISLLKTFDYNSTYFANLKDGFLDSIACFLVGSTFCMSTWPTLYDPTTGIELLSMCHEKASIEISIQCHLVSGATLAQNPETHQQALVELQQCMVKLSNEKFNLGANFIGIVEMNCLHWIAHIYQYCGQYTSELKILQLLLTLAEDFVSEDSQDLYVHIIPSASENSVEQIAFRIVEAMISCCKFDDALECIKQKLSNGSLELGTKLQTTMGFLLLETGNYKRCIEIMSKVVDEQNDNLIARFYLADALLNVDRPKDCEKQIKVIIDQLESDYEMLNEAIESKIWKLSMLTQAYNNLAMCSICELGNLNSKPVEDPVAEMREECIIDKALGQISKANECFASIERLKAEIHGNETNIGIVEQTIHQKQNKNRKGGRLNAVPITEQVDDARKSNRILPSQPSKVGNPPSLSYRTEHSNNPLENTLQNSSSSEKTTQQAYALEHAFNNLQIAYNFSLLLWHKKKYRKSCTVWMQSRSISQHLSRKAYEKMVEELKLKNLSKPKVNGHITSKQMLVLERINGIESTKQGISASYFGLDEYTIHQMDYQVINRWYTVEWQHNQKVYDIAAAALAKVKQ